MSRNISSDDIREPLLPTHGAGIEFDVKVFQEEHGGASPRCLLTSSPAV